MNIKLTDRQQQVLDLLIAFRQEHGFPPTVQELAEMLGCRSHSGKTVHPSGL
ncbi:LexA family protein [Salmonella enterica]|uniref:LexA family protein n=1 Tax=Salmonella enterica TaxID=28901 RepID=UPI003D31C4AA